MNIILLLLVFSANTHPIFNYDRAISASQEGDWQQTSTMLTNLITDDPGNPELLYDAGVAAFKLRRFAQAQTYFTQAAQAEGVPALLQEQAYFNLGNACVEQKKLAEAITHYEKVLAMNPDNERARHNLEVVKKMLEEQKKQEEEQKKQQEEQEKEKEKDSDDNKQDQQNKNQGGQNQQDKQQQNQGKDSQGGDQPQKRDQQQKRDEHNNRGKQDNRDEQNNKAKGDEDKQDGADQAGKEQKDGRDQDGQSGQPQQSAQQQLASATKELDKKIAALLEAQQEKDAQVNKQFIKAAVGKSMKGNHGQHCW